MITAILPKDWRKSEYAISQIFNTLPLVFEEYKKRKTESVGVYFEGDSTIQAEIGCYNTNKPYIDEKKYDKVFFRTSQCMDKEGYNSLKIYEDIEARNVRVGSNQTGFLKEYTKNSKNGVFKLPLCRKPMTAKDWLKRARVITTEKRLKSWWNKQIESNKPSLGCPSDELSISDVRIRFVIRNESSRSTSYSGMGMQVFDEQKNRWRFVHSATKPITDDTSYKSCKIYYDRIKFIVSKANERGLDTSYTTLCAIAKEFYYNGNKRTSEKRTILQLPLETVSEEVEVSVPLKIPFPSAGNRIRLNAPHNNGIGWIGLRKNNMIDLRIEVDDYSAKERHVAGTGVIPMTEENMKKFVFMNMALFNECDKRNKNPRCSKDLCEIANELFRKNK